MRIMSAFECDSFGGLVVIHYSTLIRESIYLAINFNFRWRNKMLSSIRLIVYCWYWFMLMRMHEHVIWVLLKRQRRSEVEQRLSQVQNEVTPSRISFVWTWTAHMKLFAANLQMDHGQQCKYINTPNGVLHKPKIQLNSALWPNSSSA